MNATKPPRKPPDDIPRPPPNPDDDGPRRGRPKKLTEELIAAVVKLIHAGNFRMVAARSLGLSPKTFYNWISLGAKYPEGLYGKLREAVLDAETKAESTIIAAIVQAGMTVDPKYLCWWAERKHSARWGRQVGELNRMRRELAELVEEIRQMRQEHEAAATGHP